MGDGDPGVKITVIDYCTIFSGPNAGVLARISYNSLLRTSDTSDVQFHVIIKDISDDDISEIDRLLTGRPVQWYHVPRAVIQRGPKANTLEKLLSHNCDDVAYTCDFVLNNCGYNQWCVLAHFDMVYEKDFLSLCRERMSEDVGMIGQHERFLALNRRAYHQSTVKFLSLASFVAVPAWPAPTNGHCQLRYKDDPRVSSPLPPPTAEKYDYTDTINPIPVRGFDTGELLELELSAMEWRIHPMQLELRECITHFGGGGSHYTEPEKTMHRERALRIIEERGL